MPAGHLPQQQAQDGDTGDGLAFPHGGLYCRLQTPRRARVRRGEGRDVDVDRGPVGQHRQLFLSPTVEQEPQHPH